MRAVVIMLLALFSATCMAPSGVFAQGTIELPELGMVFYSTHLIHPPNADRYSSLILNLWEYVYDACQQALGENVGKCSPKIPEEINIHILTYPEFVAVWRAEEDPSEENGECIQHRNGCVLYGFTTYAIDSGVFDIYFFEEPMDFYLIHEATHIIEISRREALEEARTNYRQREYFMSSKYVEWLKSRK